MLGQGTTRHTERGGGRVSPCIAVPTYTSSAAPSPLLRYRCAVLAARLLVCDKPRRRPGTLHGGVAVRRRWRSAAAVHYTCSHLS